MTGGGRPGSGTAVAIPPGSVVGRLCLDYPDLPFDAIVRAVEQATIAAACTSADGRTAALEAGDAVAGARVVVMARDRLEVARERRAQARLAARHGFCSPGSPSPATSGALPVVGRGVGSCEVGRVVQNVSSG